jgi:hypothetical protein
MPAAHARGVVVSVVAVVGFIGMSINTIGGRGA